MAFVLPVLAGIASGAASGAAGAVGLGGLAAASTPAWVGLGASALGGVTSALGAYSSSQASAQSAKYNSEVDKINAGIAQRKATDAGAAGEAETYNAGLRTREKIGAIETNQAASGIDVNKGSAVDVRASQEAVGQLDALTIRTNAAKEAYGYNAQADSLNNQSNLELDEASQDKSAGFLDAGSTLLGTAGTVGSKYAEYQNAGLLSW